VRRWIVIAAFVLGCGKGSGSAAARASGGAATVEELARAGLAAMAAGDSEAYLRLTAYGRMSGYVSCRYASDVDDTGLRALAAPTVKKTRGAALALTSIEASAEKPFVLEAGKRVAGSCVAKQDLSMVTYKLVLADGARAQMGAMKLGDRWYLSYFTGLPAGPDAAAAEAELHQATGEALRRRADQLRREAGATPDAVARALIDAALARSDERARAIHVDPDELGRALTCTDRGREAMRASREILERLAAPPADPAHQVAVAAVRAAPPTTVAPGADLGGCSAAAPTPRTEVTVELAAGTAPPRTLRAAAIELDGQWRVLALSD
jgi:hypothetical protein